MSTGATSGHLYRWLLKSLWRHFGEQYVTFWHLAHVLVVVDPAAASSPHAGHQSLHGVHSSLWSRTQCKALHAALQYFIVLHLMHLTAVLLSRICREQPAQMSGTPLLEVV
jgi:hypothetical protein